MMYVDSIGLDLQRKMVSKNVFAKSNHIPINELLAKVGIRPEEQFMELNGDSIRCSLV